jgi:hypothetical protein
MAASIARAGLVQVHRWLGIVGGLLFVAWFASGVVMMYKRMPELSAAERLARVADLDASGVQVSPADAARSADAAAGAVRLGMHFGRPVYRFGARAVFADTGEPVDELSADDALAVVRASWPEHAGTASIDLRIEEPDQWTLQSRAFLPLHRIALGDALDTRVYVAERTGELVMETTGSERAWAYPGAVLHWLYFTPLRVHSALWVQLIIWLSVAGCVLTASGILWGLMRWSPRRGYGAGATSSPYTGLLRWHHYAGLIFGLFSFTWILSGLLSMDPWSWHPGTAPTREQREALSGGSLRADDVGAEEVRAGVAALSAAEPLKEIGLVQVRQEPYLLAYRATSAGEGARLVSALEPGESTFARFADADLLDAALSAVPEAALVDAERLEAYDAYYYDRSGALPLPVLRVRYDDPVRTWLYLDPSRGVVARKEERLTRINRWLYHGLHSLDFPFLYTSRPLWDVLVIVLSLGGIAVSATTLLPGWRRLLRLLRRAD